MKKKVTWLMIILAICFCILGMTLVFRTPKNLTINGTFKRTVDFTFITFVQDDHEYFIYFQEQQDQPENHGTLTKLYDDLYILKDGRFDGKLVRLFPDYMEITDSNDPRVVWKFEKTSSIPTM